MTKTNVHQKRPNSLFDDTRLSYWHKNKIGRIEIFLLLSDFANFLPCWLVSAKLTQLTGQKISKVRKQQKKNSVQSFFVADLIL